MKRPDAIKRSEIAFAIGSWHSPAPCTAASAWRCGVACGRMCILPRRGSLVLRLTGAFLTRSGRRDARASAEPGFSRRVSYNGVFVDVTVVNGYAITDER